MADAGGTGWRGGRRFEGGAGGQLLRCCAACMMTCMGARDWGALVGGHFRRGRRVLAYAQQQAYRGGAGEVGGRVVLKLADVKMCGLACSGSRSAARRGRRCCMREHHDGVFKHAVCSEAGQVGLRSQVRS